MNERVNERFYFRHVTRASHNGSVAKSRSMLNIAIFDPWQRSLFSRQRTQGKEPLIAGNINCFPYTLPAGEYFKRQQSPIM